MKLDEIDRTKLLPRSGVAVIGPWLVIMPPGNPAIRIDLRMVDVRPATADDAGESDVDGWPDPESHVVLALDDLEVSLYIADGPEAAADLVQQAATAQRSGTRTDRGPLVLVDDEPVVRRGDYLIVGQLAFAIGEVREYALRGANLPLGNGRLLQAATALLVVAASERDASAHERHD